MTWQLFRASAPLSELKRIRNYNIRLHYVTLHYMTLYYILQNNTIFDRCQISAKPSNIASDDCSQVSVQKNGTDYHDMPAKVTPEIDGKYQARRVDKLSRKYFPLAFLLFNIVYWIVYTIPSTSSPLDDLPADDIS